MEKRKLGESDLNLAPLVLGGNVFGWTIDKKTSFDLLDTFVGKGFNSVDTANSYSAWVPGNKGGESETIIGEWLRNSGKRKDLFIFTKVGDPIPGDGKGLSESQIVYQAELSLKRLQTDYIDLYFSHKDDLDTPVEETLSAYDKLIKQGKVRYIGASNFLVPRLRESLNMSLFKGFPAYVADQPKYNLLDRTYENELQSYVKRHNIGVVTHSSLANGFLSGKYRTEEDISKSTRKENVASYFSKKGDVIDKLEKLSKDSGYSMATLALGWILKNETITAPIASATSISQLNELMRISEPELLQLPLESISENISDKLN
ncbi:MAG: aldo/keto reductase [Chitinophagaceae bacterium]|nr:aldo/keto reductase [Chitinophagaceae bacterium]